ncbi:MAG: tripartite tricarboxylate transporter TctB family protein [Nitrospirota bacterium]
MSKYYRSLVTKISGQVLFLVINIFLFVHAGSIQAPGKLPGQMGPATWPRAILLALIFCSLVKIYYIWKDSRIPTPEESTEKIIDIENGVSVEEVVETQRNWKILVSAILLVFGFVLAISVLGFPLGCLIFLWAFTYLGGWRKTIYLLFITVLGTLFIAFLFVKWVYIPLPKGRFFFDDLTIAIYKILGIF